MKSTIQILFTVIIMTGCRSVGGHIVTSPDGMFRITCIKDESIWAHTGITEWTNEYLFVSDGSRINDTSRSLAFDYYCEDDSLNQYYKTLHQEEWSELETGIQPIRIDQIALSDGTPIYFVYALTYADSSYHDYYYSYTALCIKEGAIRKYPIFQGMMELARPYSDILIINPASIDFDFTCHPAYYEYWIDHVIMDVQVDNRIRLNPETGNLDVAAGELILSFVNDSFSNIIY